MKSTAITDENRQLWSDFYKAAISFRDLAPWRWMTDNMLFGIHNTMDGTTGYCSIFGNAEEVFALAYYPEVQGLTSYFRLAHSYKDSMPDKFAAALEQHMYKVEYVDREEIVPEDRKQFKELGLKFRGRGQWIQPREHSPGFFPRFVTDEEVRVLTLVLRQAMGIGIRCEDDADLLDFDRGILMLTLSAGENGGIKIEEAYEEIPNLEVEVEFAFPPSEERIQQLRKIPLEKGALVMICQYMPRPVRNSKEERPYFPIIAILAAYGSGYIIQSKIFNSYNEKEGIQEFVLDTFEEIEQVPTQLLINSQLSLQAMYLTAQELKIELIEAPDEPIFDEIFDDIIDYL